MGSTVDDPRLIGAHPKCGPGRIHRHVPAAHNGDFFVSLDGRCRMGKPVSLHEIHTGQIFICRINTIQVFSGDIHEPGKTCAGSDKNCIECLKKFIDGPCLSHNEIGNNLYPKAFHIFNFPRNDGLGKAEFGNAVGENAAGFMEGLEDGNLVAKKY